MLFDTRQYDWGRPRRFGRLRRKALQACPHPLCALGDGQKPHAAIGAARQVLARQRGGGLFQLLVGISAQVGVSDMHGFLLLRHGVLRHVAQLEFLFRAGQQRAD